MHACMHIDREFKPHGARMELDGFWDVQGLGAWRTRSLDLLHDRRPCFAFDCILSISMHAILMSMSMCGFDFTRGSISY